MTVEELADDAEWDAFVRSHPAGLLYHSTAFRDLVARLLGCTPRYLVAREGARVVGVLPLMSASGTHGVVLNSLPYYGSNGGVLATSAPAGKALGDAYRDLATAEGIVSATVVENPFDTADGGYPSTLVDRRIAHITPLPAASDRDAVLASVEASARRNVRKAEKSGSTVERDPSAFARLHEIHAANIGALGGLVKDAAFFELVPQLFEPGRDFDLWVARKDQVVVAALLVFHFNGVVEYYTPAVDHDHRPDQPLALILAEAMTAAAAAGSRFWNWGGTWLTQESLRRFKLKWGAEEREYRYFTQVNDDRIFDLDPVEIMAAYPNFFVAPFSALRKAQ